MRDENRFMTRTISRTNCVERVIGIRHPVSTRYNRFRKVTKTRREENFRVKVPRYTDFRKSEEKKRTRYEDEPAGHVEEEEEEDA